MLHRAVEEAGLSCSLLRRSEGCELPLSGSLAPRTVADVGQHQGVVWMALGSDF